MKKNRSQGQSKQVEQTILEIAIGIAVSVGVAACLVVLLYFWNFRGSQVGGTDEWGAFGDYVGGVVNPLVGVGTLLVVVFSILLQRREMRASLEAMRHANAASMLQNFESSLFAWLDTYHDLLGALQAENSTGRAAMLSWYRQGFRGKKARSTYDAGYPAGTVESGYAIGIRFDTGMSALNEPVPSVTADQWAAMVGLFDHSCRCFDQVYTSQRWQLDAVFRTLYRLLHWIDESDLTDDRKWHYVALVRAQLSWIEMIFIFYDGLAPEGEKLSHLVNKYALLDNLAPETDELVRVYVARLKQFEGVEGSKLPKPERSALTVNAFASETARSAFGLTSQK